MKTTFGKAWSIFALAFGVLVLAGTALAGNGGGTSGNDNGGGPPATPPGQEKKQEATPPPAPAPAAAPAAASAPGQVRKAEAPKPEPKKAEPAKAAAAKVAAKKAASKKAEPRAQAKAVSSAASRSASSPAPKVTICHRTGSETNPYVEITISENGMNGHDGHGDIVPAPAGGCPAGSTDHADKVKKEKDHDKVTICHATGSATNPYVVITISQEGWDNGHSKHEHDINPVPAGGCPAGSSAGVNTVTNTSTTTDACPTETRTERVLVGVWHKTGSEKNPYVFITPNANSAHYDTGKHEDDIPVYEERTIAVATGATCATQTVTQAAASSTSCPTGVETRTERVLVGVWHKTGSEKNPYVFITPNANSAHYDTGKHEDDIPVYEERTVVVSTGATCSTTVTPPPADVAAATATTAATAAPATTAATAAPAGVAGTAATTPDGMQSAAGAPASQETAAQPSPGGVAGVTATLPQKKKERAGVLGTARTLGETAVRGRLPFTGLPLWAVALAGAALLGTGLMLRRRGQLDRL